MLKIRLFSCWLALTLVVSLFSGLPVYSDTEDVWYDSNDIYFEDYSSASYIDGMVSEEGALCLPETDEDEAKEAATAVCDADTFENSDISASTPKVLASSIIEDSIDTKAVSPNVGDTTVKATVQHSHKSSIPSTTISSDTKWIINGEVFISGKIVIKSGKRLTIVAGTGEKLGADRYDNNPVVVINSKVNSDTGTFVVEEGGELVIKAKDDDTEAKNATYYQRIFITASGDGYLSTVPIIRCQNGSGSTPTKLKLLGVDLRNNSNTSPSLYGGAISLNGDFDVLYFENVNIYRCAATSGGAIAFHNEFRMTTGTATFKNFTAKYCYATEAGGAILIRQGANDGDSTNLVFNNLTFDNCTFEDCYSGWQGGAIYINGKISDTRGTRIQEKLTIKNCNFTRCVAGKQANYAEENAAAGFSGMTFTENNNKESSAGALYLNCRVVTVEISGCNFTNCSSPSGGNAMHFHSSYVGNATNISNCTFTDCRSRDLSLASDMDDNGGTIRTVGATSTVLTITNCTFTGNYSRKNGGGVYWNASGIYNGSVYKVPKSKCSISGCTFIGNWCAKDGGAVFCEAELTISGVNEFKENRAGYNVAGEKTSQGRGGAILQKVYEGSARQIIENEKTSVALSNQTIIHDNEAISHGGGVCILANWSDRFISANAVNTHTVSFSLGGASVYNNVAGENGGGIYFNTPAKNANKTYMGPADNYTKIIQLNSGSVYNNTAGTNGGGVYMDGTTSTISITSASIYQNTSNSNGGGIYLTGDNTSIGITGGSVYSNTSGSFNTDGTVNAKGSGGGIFITGTSATVTITGGSIYSNTSTVNGAGIYVDGSTAKCVMSGGTIGGEGKGNNAIGNGGGVFLEASTLEFSGGNIDYNTAKYGGGVCADDNSKASITGSSSIAYNVASASGGGVYANPGSTITITNGAVNHNTATVVAGGIRVNGATLNLSGGTVSYNVCDNGSDDGDGGGIFADGSDSTTVKITGGEISYNTAADCGGGVLAGANCHFTLDGGNVVSNTATGGNGGGMYIRNGCNFELKNGSVGLEDKGNTAGNYGGGIYVVNNSTVTITNGNVGYNTANSFGGGICIAQSTLNFSNGNIMHNTSSTNQGGGIYLNNCTFIYTGGEIYNNKSALNGGGMYARDMVSFTLSGGNIYGNAAGFDDGSGVESKGNGGGIYLFRSTLTFSGGSIYENTATATGGGIVVNGSKLNFSGGNIRDNDSDSYGGGIVVKAYAFEDTAQGTTATAEVPYETTLTLTGGNIEGNESTASHGGGIYVCDYTTTVYNVGTVYTATVSIQTGNITNNKAFGSGGGICSNGCPVNVEGGNITDNDAAKGGGVYSAGSGAIITLSGGSITANAATANGGGAYITKNSVLRLTDTTSAISQNVADGDGGGVYISDGEFTMSGGNIEDNHSTNGNGGGIAAISSTPTAYMPGTTVYMVTLAGGTMSENTASVGFGGAIYSNGAALYIGSQSGDGGDIVRNSAKNGGGVAITGGGILEMYNGYVRHNTAKGSPNEGITTGYMYHDELGGAGGGIYISNGVESVVSAYMLSGSKVGIYGNLADFAADDVFANGNNTKLTLVRVDGMTIEEVGYERVTGWFEDYANGDTAYGMGLYGNPVVQGVRYREARTTVEAYIDQEHYAAYNTVGASTFALNPDTESGEQYIRSYINTENNYVAITLGTAKAGYGRLSIQKTGTNIDPTQVFVFLVKSVATSTGENIEFKVTVTGENAVTIMDVPDGTYTITEIESWSWRYDIDEDSSVKQTVVIGQGSGASLAPTVEFVNNLVRDKWLGGNSPVKKNVAAPVSTVNENGALMVYSMPKKKFEL